MAGADDVQDSWGQAPPDAVPGNGSDASPAWTPQLQVWLGSMLNKDANPEGGAHVWLLVVDHGSLSALLSRWGRRRL